MMGSGVRIPLAAPPNFIVLRQPRSPAQITPESGHIFEETGSLGVSGTAILAIFCLISLAGDYLAKFLCIVWAGGSKSFPIPKRSEWRVQNRSDPCSETFG